MHRYPKIAAIVIAALVFIILISARIMAQDSGLWRPTLVPQTGHSSGIQALAFSHDGRFFVTGGGDHTVRVWHAESEQEIESYITSSAENTAVVFMPGDKSIVVGSSDGSVRQIALERGKSRDIASPANPHRQKISFFGFIDGGRYLVISSRDHLSVRDTSDWREIASVDCPGSTQHSLQANCLTPEFVAISADTKILVGAESEWVFILDPMTLDRTSEWALPIGGYRTYAPNQHFPVRYSASSLAISKTGDVISVGDKEFGKVLLKKINDPRGSKSFEVIGTHDINPFDGRSRVVNGLIFANEKYLVSVGWDTILRT